MRECDVPSEITRSVVPGFAEDMCVCGTVKSKEKLSSLCSF